MEVLVTVAIILGLGLLVFIIAKVVKKAKSAAPISTKRGGGGASNDNENSPKETKG